MSPIERAARALFIREPGPYGDCVEWAIEQDFGWRDRVDDVRAVLTAIREPDDAVRKAFDTWKDTNTSCGYGEESDFFYGEADGALATMIDALLAEQP